MSKGVQVNLFYFLKRIRKKVNESAKFYLFTLIQITSWLNLCQKSDQFRKHYIIEPQNNSSIIETLFRFLNELKIMWNIFVNINFEKKKVRKNRNNQLTVSSLLKSRCSVGDFLVIPSTILLSSKTVVLSFASKKNVDFLRRIIKNTSMIWRFYIIFFYNSGRRDKKSR